MKPGFGRALLERFLKSEVPPARVEGNTLCFPMADPTDVLLLDDIAAGTGTEVVSLVAGQPEI